MERLSVNECKRIQVEILEKVDAFCEEHGLKYSLAWGSLLGAIRHNGFIPWDDDLDIMMPRTDYEKLCETYHGEGTVLMCVDNNKDYPYPFAKVIDNHTVLQEDSAHSIEMGIYIDVFPIDYVPLDEEKNSHFFRIIEFLNSAWLYKGIANESKFDFHHRLYHRFVKGLTMGLSAHEISVRIQQEIKKHASTQSGRVTCFCYKNARKKILPYEAYFKTQKHLFENKGFFVPMQYDAVLKAYYGDYMKLPPVEERVYRHSYTAYSR